MLLVAQYMLVLIKCLNKLKFHKMAISHNLSTSHFFYNSGNDKYIFKFVAGVTQDALDTDF